jgi:hypothetical protein
MEGPPKGNETYGKVTFCRFRNRRCVDWSIFNASSSAFATKCVMRVRSADGLDGAAVQGGLAMKTLPVPFDDVRSFLCGGTLRIAIASVIGFFFTFAPTANADLFEYHFFYGPATVTDPEDGNVHSYIAGDFSADSPTILADLQSSSLDITGNYNGFTPTKVEAFSSQRVFAGGLAVESGHPEFTIVNFGFTSVGSVTGPGTYPAQDAGFTFQTAGGAGGQGADASFGVLVVSEVPEPASVILLVTAFLGFAR